MLFCVFAGQVLFAIIFGIDAANDHSFWHIASCVVFAAAAIFTLVFGFASACEDETRREPQLEPATKAAETATETEEW